ncbi:DUF5050 domain-containing protein, partial [Patescibacteria group bacterium]|nr:DUF5050 domain-containing protein [Patescibacteria group bacterium]
LFSSQDFLSAESDLHSISPDEKSIINLGKGYSDAKWSPDFSKLVTREYINEPGKKYNILVTINSDEANRKELTGSDFNASNPIWTPDGKSIIFSSNDEVFIIDSNGNNLTKLLNNGFVWDISSNGAQFIYSSFNNSKMEDECFIYHMENGLSEKLAYGGQNMSFSRDGNFILFDARTDDNREIFIMNSDGSDLRQLTSKQGDNFCPSFTPDGKKIVFTSMRIDDLMKLFIMDIDGTNQERIPNFDAAPSNLTWAPTGQYFAVQSGLGHIYIMDINGNIENIIQDPVGKGKSVFLADW